MADFANPHKANADDTARALRIAEAERLRGAEPARVDGQGEAAETLRRRLLAREVTRVARRRRGGGTAAGPDTTAPAGGTAGPADAAGGRAPVGGARHADRSETVLDALRGRSAQRRAAPAAPGKAPTHSGRQPAAPRPARAPGRKPDAGAPHTAPATPGKIGTHPAKAGGTTPGAGAWQAKPGAIPGGVRDPDPDPGARRIEPIPAYLFPGTNPDLRVLILGGVHGNEPEGRHVVELLQKRLTDDSAVGRRHTATTILVPELIVATHHEYGTHPPYGARLVPGGPARPGGGPVEPNRNFPLPGLSYQEARALGPAGTRS
ncbi:hypothetical protein [Embleya sp. AB8]|uniref:hypothetical protein n=1 Tax=Embleya sp. AB8 TaxID=3156304 RepID=UPI003C7167C7